MAVPRVPEQFLRTLWQEQKFPRRPLLTTTGARVAVRRRGSANADGGPDFTGALIRIGGVLYRGDVEIHVRESSWRGHHHNADPHYNRVILHVALFAGRTPGLSQTASGRPVPLLVLPGWFTPRMYARWQRARMRARHPRCRARPSPAVFGDSLQKLGLTRIERRVRFLRSRFTELERESGICAWEQILYECVMEGMGYAKNRLPFLSLARSVPLPVLKAYGLKKGSAVQALLFGSAGFLPPIGTTGEMKSRRCFLRLTRRWRRLRRSPCLEAAEWVFFRLRPANFPTARLAAVSFLLPSLFGSPFLERLLGVLRRQGDPPPVRARVLDALLRVSQGGYRPRHVQRGGEGSEGIALGRARRQELIVNGIVPVLLLYARLSADRRLRRECLAVLRALPDGEENSITRRVESAVRAAPLRRPLLQQGMIELHRLYCAKKRCAHCPIRTSRQCSRGRTSTSRRR